MRRYLALVFPWLPVERLRGERGHLFLGREGVPVALVETRGNAVRLAAVDPAAAATGLRAGMMLADARAQVPGLEAFAHDPHADLDWLERLAAACHRYTPTVATLPPDALLLDVTGCAHAFDGERGLAADVEARFARRGVLVRHAFGETAEIAHALARYAGAPAPDERGAVRRLPVAALGLEAEDAAALARAGLKTVGDVMARPLATIAARFGEAAAMAVRRLSGEAASAPMAPRRPAAPVVAERAFDQPLTSTEHALATIGELVEAAARTLEERHQGGRRWQVRLFRADGEVHALRVETARPTRDPALLVRLLRERIDALADPLDPGFGYDLVRLDVVLAERFDAAQLRLEGGENHAPATDDPLAELVERLTIRLGRDRVRRFVPRDSHVPEQAEMTLPAIEPAPVDAPAWRTRADEADARPDDAVPRRPIFLFDPPRPVDRPTPGDTPDAPPASFRWERKLYEVARAEGPERIAGEWWRRHDGPVLTRDYYRVEDRRGRRLWIFRHGLPQETESPRWYVHGLFA